MEVNEYFRLAWGRLLLATEKKTTWGKNELKDLMLRVLLEDDKIDEAMKED